MNNKVKEGIYWTNEDGTAGYQPFTDDNFEDLPALRPSAR